MISLFLRVFVLSLLFPAFLLTPVLAQPVDQSSLEQLMSLPYLAGGAPARPASGVIRYDRSRAFPGVNLFCTSKKGEAYLMDMKGEILHTWRFNLADVLDAENADQSPFRRVNLMDDGGLLIVFETLGLLRIDKDSHKMWFHAGQYHHDVMVGFDNRIYALFREYTAVEYYGQEYEIWDGRVRVLDQEGKTLDEISIFRSLLDSSFAGYLDKVQSRPDIFHANTVRVFDGSLERFSPYYKKGNILVALRNISAIVIIDPAIRQVVWAVDGKAEGWWGTLHDPEVLPNGHLLVYDNFMFPWGADARSKVIEVDPFEKEVIWTYDGGRSNRFYSLVAGSVQRLPNENILVTESDNGRAFEITRDRKVVWDYTTPYRIGEGGQQMARVMRMQRINSRRLNWLNIK